MVGNLATPGPAAAHGASPSAGLVFDLGIARIESGLLFDLGIARIESGASRWVWRMTMHCGCRAIASLAVRGHPLHWELWVERTCGDCRRRAWEEADRA